MTLPRFLLGIVLIATVTVVFVSRLFSELLTTPSIISLNIICCTQGSKTLYSTGFYNRVHMLPSIARDIWVFPNEYVKNILYYSLSWGVCSRYITKYLHICTSQVAMKYTPLIYCKRVCIDYRTDIIYSFQYLTFMQQWLC